MSYPDMRDAFGDLGDSLQFCVLSKENIGGNIVETMQTVKWFTGVVQPLSPRQLAIKPEGERQWKWLTLWTSEDISLDNYIMDAAGIQYRMMDKKNWSSAGFIEYQLVESTPAAVQAP